MENTIMKKIFSSTKILAALLITGVAFTACSSSSDDIIEQQPVTNTEQQVYTLTIQASKGENKGGDAASTRALSYSGNALIATWKIGETVNVYKVTQSNEVDVYTSIGKLTAQGNGATATLSGSLTGDIAVNDHLALFFIGGDADYNNQTGSLEDLASKHDYAKGEAKVTAIDGSNITVVDWSDNSKSDVAFTNLQAIVKFTLKDKATGQPISVRTLKLHDYTRNIYNKRNYVSKSSKYHDLTITRATSGSEFFVALNTKGDLNNLSLTATDPSLNPGKYVYKKTGSVTFTNGKYYEVTVSMTKLTENIVDMCDISDDWVYMNYSMSPRQDTYTAQDGDVLTGKAVKDEKNEYSDEITINIADGATVTLRDLTLNGGWHEGINCLGDATIILEGTNTVTGSTAISAPAGKTLTIKGSGSLTATNGILTSGNITIEGGIITATGSGADAAIGAAINSKCGDITISGGEITATGGGEAAGIGSSTTNNNECVSTCGNISISGGKINATGGGEAAGIGAGSNGTCGNISITGGEITAKGGVLGAGIGGGVFGVCGNITIASTITKVTATHGGIGKMTSFTTPYSIGVGSEDNADSNEELIKNKYGTITLDTQEFTPTWQQGTESNSWIYDPEPTNGTNYGGLKLNIDGNTWTLTPTS